MEDTEILNTKDPKEYEIAFLAKSEEDIPEAKKVILAHSGEVTQEGQVRLTTLAYTILGANQAYFGFIRAKIAPAEAKAMEQEFKTHPSFLRVLVLKLTTVAKHGSDRPRFGNRPTAAVATLAAPVTMHSVPEKHSVSTGPLSNEALEKKIEEILK